MSKSILGAILCVTGVLVVLGIAHLGGEPSGGTPKPPEPKLPVNVTPAGATKLVDTPSQESPGSDDLLIDAAMETVEATSTRQASTLSFEPLKAIWAAERAETKALRESIQEEEDRVHRTMPKYLDIRDEMLAKADEMLRSVASSSLEVVLALSRKELDAFWDKGSFSSAEAYEHGYLARAILELTMDEHGESFEFLSALRNTINTMTMFSYADRQDRAERLAESLADLEVLWSILEKQTEMVFSNEVEPSIEAMLAVCDWVRYTKMGKKGRTRGWQWLVDNAERGRWARIRPLLEEGLEGSKNGRRCPQGLYILRKLDFRNNRKWERYSADPERYLKNHKSIPEQEEKNFLEMTELFTRHQRRVLPSLKGSREFQRRSRGIWEPEFDKRTASIRLSAGLAAP